jgi:branched-chain amino acid transport system substrate-binding protein
VHQSLKRLGAVGAAVLLGAFLLAVPASAGKTHHAASNAPIKIGLVCSCTGGFNTSSSQWVPSALDAWAKQVNASGGILKHKVQIIYKDDDSNPGTSLTDVEQLISDKVLMIYDSGQDSSWSTYAKQHHVPVFSTGSGEPDLTNTDFYSTGQTLDALFIAVVKAAQDAKVKNLATFYCAEATVCQEGVFTLEADGKKLGTPVVYSASISASSPNYTAQCLAARQAGTQILYIADAITVDEAAANDCRLQGWYVPIEIDGEDLAPSFASASGIEENSIFTLTNPAIVVPTSPIKAMTAVFNKYEPGMTKSPNYNEIELEVYAAGVLFNEAFVDGAPSTHGALTTTTVYDGLYSKAIQGTTLGGLAPPLYFTRGKPNLVDCYFPPVRLSGGKWGLPYGTKATCTSK